MLVIGQAMAGSWQRNVRSKAANWWRIMVIRVIIAKVIDKAIRTQGGMCLRNTKTVLVRYALRG
jgi:hypothetical protein